MEFLVGLLLCWSQPLYQGHDLPKLAGTLGTDEDLVAAWEAYDPKAETADRRRQLANILQALPGSGREDRADFLLRLESWKGLPSELDLKTGWASLEREWTRPEMARYIRNCLYLDATIDTPRLLGALSAAGRLELADAETVQALSERLDDPVTADAARRSLFRIARHEFRDKAGFQEWWKTARTQDRSGWLASAYDKRMGEVVRLWSERLAADPWSAIAALESPTEAVRSLGLDKLSTLRLNGNANHGQNGAGEAAGGEANPDQAKTAQQRRASIGQAIAAALAEESSSTLRRRMIGLVPRFLEGAAAVEALEVAGGTPLLDERLEVVRAIAQIQPQAQALDSLRAHIEATYLGDGVQPGGKEFHLALLDGLHTVLVNVKSSQIEEGARNSLLDATTVALSVERDPDVLEKVLAVVGVQPWPTRKNGVALPIEETLQRIAMDEGRTAAVRSAALSAWTRGAKDTAGEAELLAVLHDLVGREELSYRAVQCLKILKDPASAGVLAEQLSQNNEAWMRLEILKALSAFGKVGDPEELDVLIGYAWSEDDKGEYLDMLQARIGPETVVLEPDNSEHVKEWRAAANNLLHVLARIDEKVAALAAAPESGAAAEEAALSEAAAPDTSETIRSREIAFLLAERFPRAVLPDENDADRMRLRHAYTKAMSRWLLALPEFDEALTQRAKDASRRLDELKSDRPDDASLFVLRAELLARLAVWGEAAAEHLNASTAGATQAEQLDQLERLVDIAIAAEDYQGGLTLLTLVGQQAGEGMAVNIESLRDKLSAGAPAATEGEQTDPAAQNPNAEDGAQAPAAIGEPPASGDGAPPAGGEKPEGGGEKPQGAPAGGKEPEQPPAGGEDPEQGGGEPPAVGEEPQPSGGDPPAGGEEPEPAGGTPPGGGGTPPTPPDGGGL